MHRSTAHQVLCTIYYMRVALPERRSAGRGGSGGDMSPLHRTRLAHEPDEPTSSGRRACLSHAPWPLS